MLIFLPAVLQAQSDQYFVLQTEVDARNALFGGTVNDKGYNGVYKAGFARKQEIYETAVTTLFQRLEDVEGILSRST